MLLYIFQNFIVSTTIKNVFSIKAFLITCETDLLFVSSKTPIKPVFKIKNHVTGQFMDTEAPNVLKTSPDIPKSDCSIVYTTYIPNPLVSLSG